MLILYSHCIGHDWYKYIEFIVRDLEGDTAEDAIERREEEVRKKLKDIIPCDLTKSDGFFDGEYETRQYDIVQSAGCLEVVFDTPEAYHRAIVKLASYVKPGGYLIIRTALDADWYTFPGVNGKLYILNLNKDDPIKGMEMAGEYHSYTLFEDEEQIATYTNLNELAMGSGSLYDN